MTRIPLGSAPNVLPGKASQFTIFSLRSQHCPSELTTPLFLKVEVTELPTLHPSDFSPASLAPPQADVGHVFPLPNHSAFREWGHLLPRSLFLACSSQAAQTVCAHG